LTGDIGMGKTTLCKAVLEGLDRKTFSAFVPDPFLSREHLLKMLLIDFGAMSIDDLKSGRLNGASRSDLSYPLYEFLKSLVPLQAFAVVILDEAQNLPVPLLEEIRILSDLEAPEKLLQVVLVGQLELQAKLKLPEMRQVDQRVSVRCELQPMSREVIGVYITHRLDVAGSGPARVHFSGDALDEIYRASNGVPRVVNLICDRALHHAHLERTFNVNAPHIVRAMIDLGLRSKPVETATLKPAPLSSGATVPPPPAPRPMPSPLPAPRQVVVHPDTFAHEIPKLPEPPPEAQPEPKLDLEPVGHHFPFHELNLDDEDNEPRWQWLRPAAFVAAIVLGAAVAIAFVWYALSARSTPQTLVMPPLPGAPVLHGRGVESLPMHIAASIAMVESPAVYAIDVAVFDGPLRAANLVKQLSAQGYPVYSEVRHFSDETKHVVRVGPYIVLADADTDLARLHQLPGHGNARVSAVFADSP
jgi:type II secretory pathway predicted ATPase ExeA